jgi:sterol desaturase/sphingolipid hydroxylase (fatty acid hydroxylase superfamily)
MIAFLLTIIIAFFVTTLFGHVLHWSLHQKWMGLFNKSHMVHHLKKYPASDFYSEVYRDAGKDKSTYVGVFILGSVCLTITALSTLFFVGWLHNYLHDSFHITNHFLGKIPLFNKLFDRWIKLHYQHHVNMQTNFGIFTFHWDKLFKTFVDYR